MQATASATHRPAAPAAASDLAWRRSALWALLAAKLVAGWGTLWDIQWHILIGRDSFWIGPHILIYTGVAGLGLIVVGALARDTWAARLLARPGSPLELVTVAGVTGTRGFHLAALGVILIALAAPIDDLWHRLFGLDVTIWSPPHLLGLAGVQVNGVGCLMIAGELWPRGARGRLLALLAGGTLLLAGFAIAVYPSGRVAFLHGGVRFFTFSLLAAGLYALTMTLVARLTRRRWTPIALALGLIAFQLGGAMLGDVGFAVLQPVSVVQDVIRQEPDSPIATAYVIAERNGWRPGTSPWSMRLFVLLVPAAAMSLADPARRRVLAAGVFATTLMASSAVSLGLQPAFRHMRPEATDVAVALPLVLVSGLLGGLAGARLARAIASSADRGA